MLSRRCSLLSLCFTAIVISLFCFEWDIIILCNNFACRIACRQDAGRQSDKNEECEMERKMQIENYLFSFGAHTWARTFYALHAHNIFIIFYFIFFIIIFWLSASEWHTHTHNSLFLFKLHENIYFAVAVAVAVHLTVIWCGPRAVLCFAYIFQIWENKKNVALHSAHIDTTVHTTGEWMHHHEKRI